MENGICPQDGSRLAYVGGSYGEHLVFLSFYFCRPCRSVFGCIAPMSRQPPTVVRWHYANGVLRPLDECRSSTVWTSLPKPFRRAWESQLAHDLRRLAALPERAST